MLHSPSSGPVSGRHARHGGAGNAPAGASQSLAYRWGRFIAAFARRAVDPRRMLVDGPDNVPPEAVVWATWHGNNMLALAGHRFLGRGAYAAFVPPGAVGAAMRGWLEGLGCDEAVALPPDGKGNVGPSMRRMARSLRHGRDALVAVDGPSGPALRVRPGALWLARLARVPVVAVGFGARPALRFPRWDRHLVPLPGATIVVSMAAPIRPARGDDLPDRVRELQGALSGATSRARALLQDKASVADLTPIESMAGGAATTLLTEPRRPG